jgi:hypothetical protein
VHPRVEMVIRDIFPPAGDPVQPEQGILAELEAGSTELLVQLLRSVLDSQPSAGQDSGQR